jgi:DUF1009 family protein
MIFKDKISSKYKIKYAQKYAIIAGGLLLPQMLCQRLLKEGKDFIVIPLISHAQEKDFSKYKSFPHSLEKIGAIINLLKKEKITHVVMAGTINRPNLKELKPDVKGLILLLKILRLKNKGDDNLLKAIGFFLKKQGFTLIGVQDIMPEIIVRKKAGTEFIGKVKPAKKHLAKLPYFIELAKKIGSFDIGQAIIVSNERVLSVEGVEGTDEMIKRTSKLIKKKDYPILIKLAKPNQEERIDLPTIGLQTLENCFQSGVKGIVIEAEKTILLERQAFIDKANELKIFVMVV